MARARILIVEDEAIVAMSLRKSVERMGYDVAAVVSSGEEAVDTARAIHLDLVLMDIQLKGEMDGTRAAEAIRKSVGIPVIYLTAFSDDATLRRARTALPYGYVVKPYDDRELCAAVEMALHRGAFDADRKNAEEALGHRERLLQEMVDNAKVAVSLKDPDGRYVLANKRFEAFVGLDRATLKGRTDDELFPPPLARGLKAYDREAVTAGSPIDVEEVLPGADGKLHAFDTVKFPVGMGKGRPSGVATFMTRVGETADPREMSALGEGLREGTAEPDE